jgi:hypothetical protein
MDTVLFQVLCYVAGIPEIIPLISLVLEGTQRWNQNLQRNRLNLKIDYGIKKNNNKHFYINI